MGEKGNISVIKGTGFASVGARLLSWMGTYWTELSDDPDFAKAYQRAKGMLAAQLSLDYSELVDNARRHSVPAMHRQRFKPVVLKENARGKGSEFRLRGGGDNPPVIGPQPEGVYTKGKMFTIGGYAVPDGVVSYDVSDSDIADAGHIMVDNPVNPSRVSMRGSDFGFGRGTIWFRDFDPAGTDGFISVDTPEGRETTVWILDALVDRGYVDDFFGFIFSRPSGADRGKYMRAANAVWDVYTDGADRAGIAVALGSILDVPVARGSETVEYVEHGSAVITDSESYSLRPNGFATVSAGDSVEKGTTLSSALSIYTPNDAGSTAMRNEIGSIGVPPSFFEAPLKGGIGLEWPERDIVPDGWHEDGTPKLKFDLKGGKEDLEAFWGRFWDGLESAGTNSIEHFSDYIDGDPAPYGDRVYGTVSPMEYFLRNYFRDGTLFVAIHLEKLSDFGRQSLGRTGILEGLIPLNSGIFIVANSEAGNEEAELLEEKYDPARAWVERETAGRGKTESTMNYFETVRTGWMPACG